jgi:hypothetical protein
MLLGMEPGKQKGAKLQAARISLKQGPEKMLPYDGQP